MSEKIENEEVEQEENISEDTEVSLESSNVQEEVELEDRCASIDEEFKTKMQDEVKEAEDKYLRAYADFENIKKRLEREKYQAIDYASEKFAKDLLAPIDALEMALASASSDAPAEELLGKLKEGIELTIKSFNTAFEKHNIETVETDEFDPELHNAVMQVPSEEHENGQIVQVMQKGYKLKERLLRPAMVSICQK